MAGSGLSLVRRAAEAVRRTPGWQKVVFIVAGAGTLTYACQDNRALQICDGTGNKKKVVILGTGWASASFLRNIDTSLYDIHVVSPRNYFTFTPLLPSVTCGTVEARSIVEPVRNIVRKRNGTFRFWEAECFKIDPTNKKVHCRSDVGTNIDGNGEFVVDYDYLIVGVGARPNTFNTPGVTENCHFLKEVEDAQNIRKSVLKCFERASLPNLSEEERRKNLHFVVIGGGPTGVEFAAELHDFVNEDLAKLYPDVKKYVNISVIEAGGHILTMFDKRITQFAEEKFKRDGIDLKTNFKVVKVSDKDITMTNPATGEIAVPYGMAVWSTGVGTRPIIMDFMKQVGQEDRRALATDEWLRVQGCEDVYALGDCATIAQRKVMVCSCYSIFKTSHRITISLYGTLELYLKSNQMKGFNDLLKDSDGNSKELKELNIEQFKKALAQVDSQVKMLPATAQVAAQEGSYLANCFNKMKACEENPEGPLRIRGAGRHRFKPFRYRHLGQFAPLGGEQTACQLPGDWVHVGHSTQWLWYSAYARLGKAIHLWKGLQQPIDSNRLIP
ncbi:External alternative NAD(P)H-ubiquinone oxidoreductase B3, mitochondrial [Dichanthelium oligosanthes]|uniref:External alternative NAD(P)H-ubiquinone oxidoreductase B3, mitochondrial n=1 Tax=Dichanthelium oligosanthes TaxID=888268 RepID=A0A1E5VA16_9POAL|nr:External alternative NAD(P)H-ubiquinone oxidoreductase B3, mitochondrial [Dichanthelium oligosanthes]